MEMNSFVIMGFNFFSLFDPSEFRNKTEQFDGF